MPPSAAKEVPKPVGVRNHILSNPAALLSESQWEELLKGKEMAQLATNLRSTVVARWNRKSLPGRPRVP